MLSKIKENQQIIVDNGKCSPFTDMDSVKALSIFQSHVSSLISELAKTTNFPQEIVNFTELKSHALNPLVGGDEGIEFKITLKFQRSMMTGEIISRTDLIYIPEEYNAK
jgi:hypothetical protein